MKDLKLEIDGAYLEIVEIEGETCIETYYETAATESVIFPVDKDKALQIIEHLQKLFEIEEV